MRRFKRWSFVLTMILALTAPSVGLAQEGRRPEDEVRLRAEKGEKGQKGRSERSRRSRRADRVMMEAIVVASPNGKVQFKIQPNAERLTFTVERDGQTILDPSSIVMLLDGYDLSAGVALKETETYTVNEKYPWWGVKSVATDHANGTRVTLVHDLSYTTYTLDVRAYDDGVAFRHVIAGDAKTARVPDEYTTFVMPAGSKVWHHDLEVHYESLYSEEDISDVKNGIWAGPPLTFKLPDGAGYGSITEANLVDYAGMALEADGRRGWRVGLGHRQPLNYAYELRYGRDEARRLGKPAEIKGTITTPWRVVFVAPDLNTLVNSTIVSDLCPPPDPKYFPRGLDTEWIKPGRAVWRYTDGGESTLEGQKEFARLAGKLGYEYNVIEGFWNGYTMDERKELAKYSKEQGVGLWFWRHTNRLHTPEERKEFFDMCNEIGVVGVKLDFIDHESKESIDLYETLLRETAEHKLMVNFHGSNKPTGRARTWPNELVREAVKGMEGRSVPRAVHQATLPFTRYLAGHADYTTMHFSEERRSDSTVAHQIASKVVFHSPLLTIVAHPEKILNHPAVDVIKDVPPAWDETIVLPQSEIGQLAAFARRKGDTWFLAVMSGADAQKVELPLSFLAGGEYKATYVRDGASDSEVTVAQGTNRNSDKLTAQLLKGGGFVARFTKN